MQPDVHMPRGALPPQVPHRGVRGCLDAVLFYVVTSLFGLVGLATAVVAAVLYVLLPRRLGKRVGRRINCGLFRTFAWILTATGLMRLDLGALDRLRGRRGVIIAPNHVTSLDALFVISRLPDLVCIMKAAIWDNPVMGGGARLAGYLRNDQTSSMFRSASEELGAGEQLLLFPEGTRGTADPISPFKGGVGILAQHSGAAVQTVFVECDGSYLRKGWPFWRRPQFPITYRMRLGEAFTLEKNGDVKEFVARLERYYARELGGALPAAAAPPEANDD